MLYVARAKKLEEHVTPVRRLDVTRSGSIGLCRFDDRSRDHDDESPGLGRDATVASRTTEQRFVIVTTGHCRSSFNSAITRRDYRNEQRADNPR